MSLVSAKFAKANLQVPVSLVVDKFTVEWMQTSNIYDLSQEIFDKIIEIEKPVTQNIRVLTDGYTSKTVPFINSNRASVWDLTPYDRTLLIDSDFLIMSNRLDEYWEVNSSVMLSSSMQDVRGDRKGILDSWVSEVGIPLYWATTVMFTKNNESKVFFDLVDVIRTNYNYFADLFNLNGDTANLTFNISSLIFWLSCIILSTVTLFKNWSLIPLLGLVTCLYLLTGMTAMNWAWFGGWLVLGLVVYFMYGYKKSKLA
jgi:hypothetical protein